MGRSTRRQEWRKAHRWLGLFAGLLFAFSGLSGSVLVFYQEIDRYLNPALLTVVPGGEHVALSEILASAQRVVPPGARPTRLYLPRAPGAVMKLRFVVPVENREVLLDVMVDPSTAKVLGQREWGGYLMSLLYKLHYSLLLGDAGETVVGIVGLLLICSVLCGLYLCCPKPSRLFQALALKRRASRLGRLYDWHRMVGALAAVPLMVIAFSGFYMIFPHYVKPLVGLVLPVTETAPASAPLDDTDGVQRITLDTMTQITRDHFPSAQLQRIHFPVPGDRIYRIVMRQPGEVRKTSGSTQLWIDSHDGTVLGVQEPQTMTSGEALIGWLFPLHNGEAFGWAGRFIVLATGLMPITLYATGLMIWLGKRNARRRRDCRRLR